MTDKDLIDMLRTKQICTGFKPDGHGDVSVVYGPDPVTAEAADRIEALTKERERLWEALMDAREAWDNHMEYGEPMQGWWVADARAALKGETP